LDQQHLVVFCKHKPNFAAFTNFTVRACGDWGSRCEASATVCAEQGGVGQCFTCEDDLCNGALELTLTIIFVIITLTI
ncbi:unnamed protein product, partial [Cylicostephanus goldi]